MSKNRCFLFIFFSIEETQKADYKNTFQNYFDKTQKQTRLLKFYHTLSHYSVNVV